jgi:outer membrane protein insertion porin family
MRAALFVAIAVHAFAALGEAAGKTQALAPVTVCGLTVPAPAKEPPPGANPVLLSMLLCFDKQGGASVIAPETYLYYIQLKPSEPSRDRWVAYTDDTERIVLEDFRRLWATNFLDDLSVEVQDYRFPNGAVGKLIVFHLEERQRIKMIDYDGATRVSRADINDRLKEKGIDLRLDAFLDHGALRRVSAAVRELYAEKGYQYAVVSPAVRELAGGPKLAHVIFTISEGPKVAIRDVEFLGNRVFSDRTLANVLKANKAQSVLSLVTGRGTFNEEKFAEDAQSIVDYYRDRGYIATRVGQPTLRVLDDSPDGKTRWVQLRVEVTEGERFTVGEFTFEGNAVVATDALRPLFELETGDIYSQQRITKGLERAREWYGAGGYFEFTAYPDLRPRDRAQPPTVDITMRLTEGKQYFVNRLEFAGNTQTRDEVLRREMLLVEGGVFNTQALKNSIRRLNQLGYFKPLDDQAIAVERTAGTDDKVDVQLKVEEQNRNQVNFGAGVSQYEGVFINASYTTSNFLGRGESVTVAVQTGTRSSSYQLSFTEPYLFGRAITAGGSVYSRKIDYALRAATTDYSEVRSGFNVTSGVPVRRFTRVFATYGYELVDTAMTSALEQALRSGTESASFLLDEGRFTESSVTPSIVHNTADNPFAPRSGRRLTASYQYAGGFLGGSSQFIKPEVEAVVYVPVSRRTAFGLRANAGRIWNFGGRELPYYQRYFLGGETQIRGFDVRTVGPLNANNVALGGTKFVVFNAEYYYDILSQVRALVFHDAGQAFAESQPFDLRQLRTSSGVELRVTLPILNVPFRLIYAWNVYRDSFQPARTFKFAVGTTF